MKDPSEESRYAVMASELESVRDQRNITFELCAWGFGNVETFGGQMGHLWRTSQDITDTWHGVLWNIDVNDEVNRLEINLRFDLTLLNAGVWRLTLGRGGRNPPPHLFEVLLVPWTQKMVPNPKTRRD